LKATAASARPAISEAPDVAWFPDRILSGDSSTVFLTVDSESASIAVKTAKSTRASLKCAVGFQRRAIVPDRL
jgi:hypothetical protein